MKIKVMMLLRSGGDYDDEYVLRLARGIRQNVDLDVRIEFLCLTNKPITGFIGIKNVLVPDLPEGWWGKPLVFNEPGPCLYMDLDTIVIGDITPFVKLLYEKEMRGERTIYMLESFRYQRCISAQRWASGIMAWTGTWKETILSNFSNETMNTFRGDQEYISKCLRESGAKIESIGCYFPVVSYKHHCRNGIPKGTVVICFHGKPRPREVEWLENENN